MTGGAKPNVLIVTENWADCDPGRGPSVQHANFIQSLRSTGLAEVDTFFIDECVVRTGRHADELLHDLCVQRKPDILFLKMVRGSDLNPSAENLARIRRSVGVKVVSVYGDTTDEPTIRWIETYSPAVDLNIVQDCYSTYPRVAADVSKFLPAWTPQDPAIFHNGESVRDIGAVFLGSVMRYPERKLAVYALAQSGLPFLHRGGQSEDPLSMESYGDLLRRSKISLNFSRPVFDEQGHQCKGRVIETTLCGALLLEQRNPETPIWLTPGRHYVEFTDQRDLVDKVRYYLAHEDERAAIAAAGAAKAQSCYSAVAYWQRVFNALAPAVRQTVPA
jgi:hypothetical protein